MLNKQCEDASAVQGKGLQQTYKLEALHICVDETTKRVCVDREEIRGMKLAFSSIGSETGWRIGDADQEEGADEVAKTED